ncbi:hypothetical protein WA158_003662 [Blastocystis sp. Blastoise]
MATVTPTDPEPVMIDESKAESSHIIDPEQRMSTNHIHISSRMSSSIKPRNSALSFIGDDSLHQDKDPVRVIEMIRQQTSRGEIEAIKGKTLTFVGIPKVPRWYKSPMNWILIIGSILSFVLLFCPLVEGQPSVQYTAALILFMATLWVTEALPMSITALIPVIYCPIFGIMSAEVISQQYFNNIIFMFLSGFIISLALEHWNLHIRIALFITKLFSKPQTILFGIMFASWFLSIWLSNTAAALMMYTNASALVIALEQQLGKRKMQGFSKACMLGIAFSCSIGGLPSIISSPPNMIMLKLYQSTFANYDVPTITFVNWLLATLPIAIILLVLEWVTFVFIYCPPSANLKIDASYAKNEYKKLGKASYEEWVVGIMFILAALLWLFRSDMAFGDFTIYGWANLFGNPSYITDGTCGMFIALLLFVIPTKKFMTGKNGPDDDKFVMTWETAKKLPWDLVLLFGGGFALAEAVTVSGFGNYLGSLLSGIGQWPLEVAVSVMSIVVCFITSFTSGNTTTSSIVSPIAVGMAIGSHIHPLTLLYPVTLCISCAFLMPIASPPNLIVFTSGRITVMDMFKSGLIITLFAVIVILLCSFFIAPAVFGYDYRVYPSLKNVTSIAF